MTFIPDEPFRPAPGLANPHAQTIYAALVRPTRGPAVTRERWETPDGDFLDVDLMASSGDAPRVFVLHGLEGSSRAGYVAAIFREAAALGWGGLALNFRSCSGEPNRLLRSYHSGETSDARFVLERWRGSPEAPVYAVGFSLGGNVLLRLLAEWGDACPISAAVAVSAPFDLAACAKLLDAGWLYRSWFLRPLKAKALAKARRFPGLDASRIRRARGLADFDDAVTAPIHGFQSAAEYYARCASGPVLGQIRRPTLLLSAEDDPIAPARHLPGESRSNPALEVLTTARGGHVGFVGGSVWRPRFWAERQAVRFLAARSRPGTS